MDWKSSDPSHLIFNDAQFHDCDAKHEKLKKKKRGRILISIVNNKLEKRKEKSRWAPRHFSCRLSLSLSIFSLSLSFSPSDRLELFEFQHDSRLYKGISVHVCIYLFMCNLMGIVNMVRLLKLLFFIYLVPPVLVGLNIRLVLHVILWFLEKKNRSSSGWLVWFIFFFISLGYFNPALL